MENRNGNRACILTTIRWLFNNEEPDATEDELIGVMNLS